MSNRTAQNLATLIVIGMAVQLGVITYIWYSNYQGRVATVTRLRDGCFRSKLDRTSNASGWRIAESARRGEGQVEIANKYANIAYGLEKRSRINCAVAFPKARLFEW